MASVLRQLYPKGLTFLTQPKKPTLFELLSIQKNFGVGRIVCSVEDGVDVFSSTMANWKVNGRDNVGENTVKACDVLKSERNARKEDIWRITRVKFKKGSFTEGWVFGIRIPSQSLASTTITNTPTNSTTTNTQEPGREEQISTTNKQFAFLSTYTLQPSIIHKLQLEERMVQRVKRVQEMKKPFGVMS